MSCISIKTSDVILDGAGHRIDGVDDYEVNRKGVVVVDRYPRITNVTIKNVVATDWNQGFNIETVSNSRLLNNTGRSNGAYGIYAGYDADNNTFAGNRLVDNLEEGIAVATHADGNVIRDNYAAGNDRSGIEIVVSNGTRIVDNEVVENKIGIVLGGSDDSVVRNNTIQGNREGIRVTRKVQANQTSDNNTVVDNVVTNSTDYGVFVMDNNTGTNILDNEVTGSDQGVRLVRTHGNELVNNSISRNRIGIHLIESEDNSFRRNTVGNNSQGGLLLAGTTAAMTTDLHENRITRNTRFGVKNRAPVALDATRNYWGASDGPSGEFDGSGDAVVGNVTIRPFYVDANLTTVSPFPNGVPGVGDQPPRDPDGDGAFEDVNGDGTADFADAVALAFANFGALTPEQCAALDFDGDGDCGFGDAVALAFQI